MRQTKRRRKAVRRGLSIMEILVVVTLMGILAVVLVARFAATSDDARRTGCHVKKSNIEVQAELWYRNKGSWPKADLSDIFAEPAYFPDAGVNCPVDGSSYSFDTASGRVAGHDH